jgi:hypothetical protein
MSLYQHQLRKEGLSAAEAALQATKQLAGDVVSALDRVRSSPSVLSSEQRSGIYAWARQFPGASLAKIMSDETLQQIIESKVAKGLL